MNRSNDSEPCHSADAPATPAGAARREMLAVALILLAAAALRVVYLLQYRANVPYFHMPVVDSSLYDVWAQKVASGKGYGPKPFYMAALYPYFLALIYKLAGHRLAVVYVIQSAMGVANLWMVYLVSRQAFNHRTGLVAMVLIIFYAPLLYLESKLLTETLAVALNLVSIMLLIWAMRRPAPTRFLAAGVVLGISAICRSNALITVLLIAPWLLLSYASELGVGRALSRLVVPLLVGAALAVLPVTARNYFVGRDIVLLSSNGGIVFAQANNKSSTGVSAALAGFTGSIHSQQDEEIAVASSRLGRQVKPSEASAYWFGEGVRYVREDPRGFMRLVLRKAIWSLHNREARCSYNPYLEYTLVPVLRYLALPFSLLAGLALYGLLESRKLDDGMLKRRYRSLLGLCVLSVFLSLIIFSVSSRYRAPAVPFMAMFAGAGIVSAAERLRRNNLVALGPLAACVASVMMVSLVPYPIPPITAEAYNNLGSVYVNFGKPEEALVQLEKALQSNPRHVFALINTGRALALQKRFAEAEQYYRRALDVKPENREAHYYLGYALASQNRLDEAAQQYKEAIRLYPDYADAHFNLGVIYDSWQRYDDAIASYLTAVEINPAYADAHHNLAVDLYETGRYAEAWKHVRLCREHGGTPHPGFVRALSEKMPEVK